MELLPEILFFPIYLPPPAHAAVKVYLWGTILQPFLPLGRSPQDQPGGILLAGGDRVILGEGHRQVHQDGSPLLLRQHVQCRGGQRLPALP